LKTPSISSSSQFKKRPKMVVLKGRAKTAWAGQSPRSDATKLNEMAPHGSILQTRLAQPALKTSLNSECTSIRVN